MMIMSESTRRRKRRSPVTAFMASMRDVHQHRKSRAGGFQPTLLLAVVVVLLSLVAAQAAQAQAQGVSDVSTSTSTAVTRQNRRRNSNNNNNIKTKKSNIVQVFLLAGDDNVEGYAWSPQLYNYIHNESIPLSDRERYFHLIDRNSNPGQWVERDDVFVTYQHERHGDWVAGPLNMYDYGVRSSGSAASSSGSSSSSSNATQAQATPAPSYFGPEVEMGHVLGNAFPNDYILIVKAGWSGKSLARDFASPSSDTAAGNKQHGGGGGGSGIGGYYWHSILSALERAMDESVVREIIETSRRKKNKGSAWGQHFHHHSKLHVQLAGAVWFQGFPDIARTEYRDTYEQHLIALLRDFQKYLKPYYARNHYYEQGETESLLPDEKQMEMKEGGGEVAMSEKKKDEPYLPIVVGELGMSGDHASSKELAFRAIQQRVCEMAEFNTTTLFVPTARYVIRDEPHLDANTHYYGRADTMIEIGNALAMGLLQLLFQQESFGESDNEREADYQAYEDGMQSRFLITIVLSLGLLVLLLAIRRGLQQREDRLVVVQQQSEPAQAEMQEESQATKLLLQRTRENLVWSLRLVVQFFRPTRRKRKEKKKRRCKHRKRRDRVRDEYGRQRQQHDHDDDDDSHSSSLSSQDSEEEQPNYNHVHEEEDLGSLPGSDSDLYELDEISSRHDEEDDVMMMDATSNIPRVV